MHPDLWLDEPTLQIISLTSGGTGGPNEAPTAVTIRKADGQFVGTKGIRPTLVLAGDVNLDGKVNALDLQASIAQLGTNPQAIGVMPLADLNNDNIVDTHDVVLLLQDYGEETDIYEGLWDGSRLLAVVGGSAGFGTIGGGGLAGNWGIEPGRRPADDCLRAMPGNDGPSLLPWLLRRDARTNCAQCPGCDDPDPTGCFQCHEPGEIIGGQITATPEQPKPGDTVVFSWTPFELVGRSRKCQTSCGGDDDDVCVDPPVPLSDSWVIEKKNPLTGDWEEILNGMIPGTVAQTTQQACAEIRLRLTSQSFDTIPPNCAAVESVQKLKEVQFAPFTLDWECLANTPTTFKRTTIGVNENVYVEIMENNTSALWTVLQNGTTVQSGFGPHIVFNAGCISGTTTVRAQVGSCTREIEFTVIQPSGIQYELVDTISCACRVGGGIIAKIHVLPKTVSFTGLGYCEGSAAVSASGLEFGCTDGLWHDDSCADSPIPWTIGENNICTGFDYAWIFGCRFPPTGEEPCDPSTFAWPIPVYYVCNGIPKFITTVTSFASIAADCTTTYSVGGVSVSVPIWSASSNCHLDCE